MTAISVHTLSSTRHFSLETTRSTRQGVVRSCSFAVAASPWVVLPTTFSLDPVVPFLQPPFQCRTNLGLFAAWFATTAR